MITLTQAEMQERFLQAWKKGVRYVGPTYFKTTKQAVEAATSVRQLAPDLEKVRSKGLSGSGSQRLMLLHMLGLYNGRHAIQIAEELGASDLWSGDNFGYLDHRHRETLTAMMLNYSGW